MKSVIDNDGRHFRQSPQHRERLGRLLSIVTLGIYVSFIAGLVYAKAFYASSIVPGSHLTFAGVVTLLVILVLIGLTGYFLNYTDYRPSGAGDES